MRGLAVGLAWSTQSLASRLRVLGSVWHEAYLPEHNRRFRRIPAQPEDYHRAAPRAAELEDVFHLETGRILGNDWVVRHDNRYFQVKAQARNYAPAKSKVTVCEWEDGRLQIRYRGRAVSWEEIPGPAQAAALEATAQKQKPPTPKSDHPWRQGFIARCAPGANPEHRPCR